MIKAFEEFLMDHDQLYDSTSAKLNLLCGNDKFVLIEFEDVRFAEWAHCKIFKTPPIAGMIWDVIIVREFSPYRSIFNRM